MVRRPAWVTVATHSILIVTSMAMLYPLVFMIAATFTSPTQYYRTSFLPIPDVLDFRNYAAVLLDCTQACIYRSGMLTVLRASWYIAWTLLVSVFGGYVFARLSFPGKQVLFLFFLAGLMVPAILLFLPQYILLARWPLVGGNDALGQGGSGFVNAWPALFLLGLVEVLPLFLVKQNYEMLPPDYEEAALVDGADTLRMVLQIYVPMLRPSLTAVSVLTFVHTWNDYLGPLIYVGGNRDLAPIALTVQRLIYQFTLKEAQSLANYPLIFAAATLMSLPAIGVYFAAQRYFVQGLVGVGIKG